MSTENLYDARVGMTKFLEAQRSGSKVYEAPLYSRVDLVGLADANNILQRQEIVFFAVPVGRQDQSFGRNLTFADTNIEGTGGALPGGVEFIADRFGVYLDPAMPRWMKETIAEYSAIFQNRLSHVWKMGKSGYWPAAEYGVQSMSTTTAATDYAVNGRTGSCELPEGGELYFPAKQILEFTCRTEQPFNVTDNGFTVANGGTLIEADNAGVNPEAQAGPLTGLNALMGVILRGWQFEVASVG